MFLFIKKKKVLFLKTRAHLIILGQWINFDMIGASFTVI